MIDKIVSKLSKPFQDLTENGTCATSERAKLIVNDMVESSLYEMIDLNCIVQEIQNIFDTKQNFRDIKFEIILDDSHGKVEVLSSVLQVILDILNNSLFAFDSESSREQIKLHLTSNEYGLEIECCDNAQVKHRDTNLYISREIIQQMFEGKIDPSSREFSRSNIYPVDNSEKACFYIAIPYSKNCLIKEDF